MEPRDKAILAAGTFTGFILTFILSQIRYVIFDVFPWQYTTVLAILIGISATESVHSGKFSWMTNQQKRISTAMNLASLMVPKQPSFSVNTSHTGKSTKFLYQNGIAYHTLNVPYTGSMRRSANHFNVFLIKGGIENDVTHQSGISYFCTAGQLGGTGYKVVDKSTGETVKTYDMHTIPEIPQIPGF